MKAKGRTRHLLFVRHGQYSLDDTDVEGEGRHGLTELGRQQSRLLGERLAAMAAGVKKDKYGEVKVRYEAIYSSDVLRAVQTADIVAEYLPDVPRKMDPLLAEGPPAVPHPGSSSELLRSADRWEASARIEAAFRRHVHREVDHKAEAKRAKHQGDEVAPPEVQGKTGSEAPAQQDAEHSYEIFVCHGNVIRYFVMRALQLPPEAWLRLRGDNCGITELIIRPTGGVSLGRFGDTGHLPIEMATFH